MALPTAPDAVAAGLTAAEVIFCAEYVKDQNATRAYEVAFPYGRSAKARSRKRKLKPNTLKTEGSKLLALPAIKSHIARLTKSNMENALALEHDASILLQKVLTELAAIAFFDVTQFMTTEKLVNGKVRPVLDIQKILADPIASKAIQFEQGTTGNGEGGVIDVYKLKKYGKLEALDKLLKYAMLAQGITPREAAAGGGGVNVKQMVLNVNFPVPGSLRKPATAVDADIIDDADGG